MTCRNKDKKKLLENSIKGNMVQFTRKGLNKLETQGSRILNELGISHEVQILMFEKFLVDVLIRDKKIVIQWDGEYWHTKEKRQKLDFSQDRYFAKCGYKVLRVTDIQIKNNINQVYDNIKRAVQ